MLFGRSTTPYATADQQTVYAIGFDYNLPSEVSVEYESGGERLTFNDWEFLGPSSIRFTSDPPFTSFEITRTTDISQSYGSPKFSSFNCNNFIDSSDLNGNFELLRLSINELGSTVESIVSGDTTGGGYLDDRYLTLTVDAGDQTINSSGSVTTAGSVIFDTGGPGVIEGTRSLRYSADYNDDFNAANSEHQFYCDGDKVVYIEQNGNIKTIGDVRDHNGDFLYLRLKSGAFNQTVNTTGKTVFKGHVELPGGGGNDDALTKSEIKTLIGNEETTYSAGTGLNLVSGTFNVTAQLQVNQTNGNNSNPKIVLSGTEGTNKAVQIVGGTNCSVTRDDSGKLTIDADDQSASYTAGSGINIDTTTSKISVDSEFLCSQVDNKNNNPVIRLKDTDGTKKQVQIVGGSNCSVTRNNDSKLTIVATNTDTTYSAGNGLQLSTTEFSVKTDGNSIGVSADGIKVNASNVGKVSSAADADEATKLKNSRTLWGQSFNGTANVSGPLTNVGNITGNTSSNLVIQPGDGATKRNLVLRGNSQLPEDGSTSTTGGNVNIGRTNGGFVSFLVGSGVTEPFRFAKPGTSNIYAVLNPVELTASRFYKFPDKGGTIALTSDIASEVTVGEGEINVNPGNGLKATGNNANANQTVNTTRTLSVKTNGNTIGASSDGIKVNVSNLGKVPSATIADTLPSRTLWGQEFDGSANVSGTLTDVNNITGNDSNMTVQPVNSATSRNLILRGNDNTGNDGGGSVLIGNKDRGSVQFYTSNDSGYRFFIPKSSNNYGAFNFTNLKQNRTFFFPNEGGTIALTANTVNLTGAQTITGSKTFQNRIKLNNGLELDAQSSANPSTVQYGLVRTETNDVSIIHSGKYAAWVSANTFSLTNRSYVSYGGSTGQATYSFNVRTNTPGGYTHGVYGFDYMPEFRGNGATNIPAARGLYIHPKYDNWTAQDQLTQNIGIQIGNSLSPNGDQYNKIHTAYGIYLDVPRRNNRDNYNLYINGLAENYIKGDLRVDGTFSPQYFYVRTQVDDSSAYTMQTFTDPDGIETEELVYTGETQLLTDIIDELKARINSNEITVSTLTTRIEERDAQIAALTTRLEALEAV